MLCIGSLQPQSAQRARGTVTVVPVAAVPERSELGVESGS